MCHEFDSTRPERESPGMVRDGDTGGQPQGVHGGVDFS